jgi:ubiquinone biosynthesis protein
MMSATRQPASPQPAFESPRLDGGTQLRAWLSVLDAVLVAIEQTAWQAREIGQRVKQAALGTEHELSLAASGSRALAEELARWPERLARLGSTGLTLTRIAAGYRFHNTKAAFLSRPRAARALDDLHRESARRFYALSARQGGAFLKVGQMLSSRPDLLPAVWIEELSGLQDAAPEVPFEEVKAMLERELGAALEDRFAAFDASPVASASIGQVHRARLHDGRDVAVKVQRPGIAELVTLDLELLELFARGLSESLPPVDLDTIVHEVKQMIQAELDYVREAETTERVADFFASDPRILVPRVIGELSGPRVLVTSFMEGEKITHVLELLRSARAAGDPEAQIKLTQLMARVVEAYARQILELGHFQADPHPGNLLAREDGTLVLLDFGCAKTLDAHGQRALVELAMSFISADAARMAASLDTLGFATDSATPAGLSAYAELVISELNRVRAAGGSWPDQAQVLGQISRFAKTLQDDPITRLPQEMVMLGRVIGTLAGLFLHYEPDVSAAGAVLPLVLSKLSFGR